LSAPTLPKLSRPRQHGVAARLLRLPSSTHFEWRAPKPEFLAGPKNGLTSLSPEGLDTTSASLVTFEMPVHEAEWVNFTHFLNRHSREEMISTFGFLRLGFGDKASDWEDLSATLNLALRPWGGFGHEGGGGPALTFGSNQGAIRNAKAILQTKVQEAIDSGSIAVKAQDDLAVRVGPVDLRGFMLLDAAEAVHTEARYQRCRWCERAFRLRDKRLRSYCSEQCRGSQTQSKFVARRKARPIGAAAEILSPRSKSKMSPGAAALLKSDFGED
jgi:hypothetical protein